MDLRQIRSFLTVAETGSVTRAAEMLHVVQPAVSRQLKLLEDELGVLLFERGRQGMLLTEAGYTFAERAGQALKDLDNARLAIQSARGVLVGSVGIGLLPSSSNMIAAPLATTTHSLHPGIQIRFTVGFTDHLSKWLEEGEIDVALLYNPEKSAKISTIPILLEPLYICGVPSFGLRNDQVVPVDFLSNYPMVLPSRRHGLRTLVDNACAISQINLAVVAETNAQAVQKELVLQGMGLGIMPRIAIRDEINAGLLTAARIDHSSFLRTIALAVPTGRKVSPAAKYLTKALIEHIVAAVRSRAWLDATLVELDSSYIDSVQKNADDL